MLKKVHLQILKLNIFMGMEMRLKLENSEWNIFFLESVK